MDDKLDNEKNNTENDGYNDTNDGEEDDLSSSATTILNAIDAASSFHGKDSDDDVNKVHVSVKKIKNSKYIIDAVITHTKMLLRSTTEMAWTEIHRITTPLISHDMNRKQLLTNEEYEKSHVSKEEEEEENESDHDTNDNDERIINSISSLIIWIDIQMLRSHNAFDVIQYEASKLFELSDEADDIVMEIERSLKEYITNESNFQREFPAYELTLNDVGESRLKAIKKSLNRARSRANINIWQDCESIVQDTQGIFHMIQYWTREEMEIFLSQDEFFTSTTTSIIISSNRREEPLEDKDMTKKTVILGKDADEDEKTTHLLHTSKKEAFLRSFKASMTEAMDEVLSLIHAQDSLVKELDQSALQLMVNDDDHDEEEEYGEGEEEEEQKKMGTTALLSNMVDQSNNHHALSFHVKDDTQSDLNHNNLENVKILHQIMHDDMKQWEEDNNSYIETEQAPSLSYNQSQSCCRHKSYPMSLKEERNLLLQKCSDESRRLLEPWVMKLDDNIDKLQHLIRHLWTLHDSCPTITTESQTETSLPTSSLSNHNKVYSSLQFIHSLQRRLRDAMEFYQMILPSLSVFCTQMIDCTVRSAIRRNDFETNLKTLELRVKQSMLDEDVAVEHLISEMESVCFSATPSPLSTMSAWNIQDCNNLHQHQQQDYYQVQQQYVVNTISNHSIDSIHPSQVVPVNTIPLSSSSSSPSSTFIMNDILLVQFLSMDFPYDDIVRALRKSDNNFDVALNYLTGYSW